MQHLDEGTIHAWLDGALTAEEARQAEAHVSGCATCADAVAEARGLIAASSIILSKLDGAMPERDTPSVGPDLSIRDIAVARAEAAARPRPGVRRWFAGSPMRAAAAVLILAGGVAVVGNMTSRDELAGVVADAAMESASLAPDSARPQFAASAAQDATAAEVERVVAAPPPTVAAAPALPRPVPVVGGGAASRQAAVRAPVGVVDGSVAGIGAAAAGNREATTPTAAPAEPAAGSVTGAAAEEDRGVRRLEERLRRVEQPQERDFAEAAKAGSPEPLRQRLAAPAAAAPSGRLARAEAAASDQPTALLAPRCYALTLAPWSPVTAPVPAAPFTRIFLAPDTGTTGPATGQRLVRPMAGAADGAYAAAWWTEVSPSTLVLTWATGSEGIVMRLVRSGSGLSGTARTFGTSGGTERTSNVTGTEVDCGEAR